MLLSCPCSDESVCGVGRRYATAALSGAARQLSQRESLWRAGPLPTGRLRPDRTQKGGPCYRGQARLSTTSQALRASSPKGGASGVSVRFMLDEQSTIWRKRAGLATEGRPVFVQPLRHCFAMPPPLVGEALAGRATSYWTPEARYGAKARALLQRAAASGQAHLVKLLLAWTAEHYRFRDIVLCSSRRKLTDMPRAPPLGQRRRPPPAAETGRSCWGSGQQDASDSEADAGSRNPALAGASPTERARPLPNSSDTAIVSL